MKKRLKAFGIWLLIAGIGLIPCIIIDINNIQLNHFLEGLITVIIPFLSGFIAAHVATTYYENN